MTSAPPPPTPQHTHLELTLLPPPSTHTPAHLELIERVLAATAQRDKLQLLAAPAWPQSVELCVHVDSHGNLLVLHQQGRQACGSGGQQGLRVQG